MAEVVGPRPAAITAAAPYANIRSMRWSNLSLEAEERARLPGYRDEAVVRHFEAPDAIPTRFYEVRAKSILNRVPAASQMPFRWTINPYRGCTHACIYCFARPTHTYLDFDAGRDFEREIVVKVNAPERLRVELAKPSWQGEHIALGTNTDPYQWVEGRYKLTPRHLGGDDRGPEPRVGADQVAAAAARSGSHDRAAPGGGLQRGAVGARRSMRRRGGRPSRTRRIPGRGWRRWPSSTGRGSAPGSSSRR